MIKFVQRGDFSNITKYLKNNRNLKNKLRRILDEYGQIGVQRLEEMTPKDTGLTSRSWYYKVEISDDIITLSFLNNNIQDGVNVAILIQYGHGTPSGYWINGRDYINPALQSVFDYISEALWKEVTA